MNKSVWGLLLLLALPGAAQDTPPRGAAREAMWPAPTATDWEKPCLITWQRSWEDAVAVSKETGKPILVCINMDGEIASEHYAGVRYRQPDIAVLYEPYVTVIASVYRHNPRDYDDEGRRILCPRFGCVTCGEHIAIEPTIFEKFCDGRRIAPRHIAVDLEGKETYDVFYRNDTASVFADIRDQVPESRPPETPIVRGDRPLVERVKSRHLEDRLAVEKAYREGDAAQRQALLDAARAAPEAAPLELLRLAIFGMDVDLAKKAREALARSPTADATDLIAEAMRVPMSATERDALIGALKRLGDDSPLARWLAGVHKGLAATSSSLDANAWGAGAEYPAPTASLYGPGLVERIERRAERAAEVPEDPAARVELAEATLALALKAPESYATNPRLARLAAEHLFTDARALALEAETLGAEPWRVHSVLALAAYYTDQNDEAYARAALAAKAIPPGEPSWNSMAVITIFAEWRWKAIKAAVKANEDWPPEWLADVHAAYSLLLRHPLGTDRQVMWHYDLLDWIGVNHRAERVLREGLKRFRTSEGLHALLRARLLKSRGPDGLVGAYDAMLRDEGSGELQAYAGFAAGVAADQYRRVGAYEKAILAYESGIAHYEKAIENDPAGRDVADHAIALALAAVSRVAYQLDDDDRAAAAMLASIARRPASAGSRDGHGITPGETAQMLLARLRSTGKEAAATELADALASLDRELLRPDRGLEER